MFWKKETQGQRRTSPAELAAFPKYVVKKIAPGLDGDLRAAVLDTAQKEFGRNPGLSIIERMLLGFGRDVAMLGSLALAKSIEEATGKPTSDIEYGDCYACTLFCLASTLRKAPDIATDALEFWGNKFQTDVDYLIFAGEDEVVDLYETGWEKFGFYHENDDAILPRAHLHLLAQVIRHRRNGHETPYQSLDPMTGPDPIVFASLEHAMDDKATHVLNHWIETAVQVQEIAEDAGDEFWPDW